MSKIFMLGGIGLDVTVEMKDKEGIAVRVSTNCANWPNVVRFINDFKTNIMPSQHEKESG
jgi:hypothetical protein